MPPKKQVTLGQQRRLWDFNPSVSKGTAVELQREHSAMPIPEGASGGVGTKYEQFVHIQQQQQVVVSLDTHFMDHVLDQIRRLEARVSALEEHQTDAKAGEVVVLRTITKEEARTEIRELFRSGKTLYYSDIAEQLRIDLPVVVEICSELMAAGEIEIGRADNGDVVQRG